MFWQQNRDIKMTKEFYFWGGGGGVLNQIVMKRGEMQKKISIIVLNVKVKRGNWMQQAGLVEGGECA